LRYQAFPYQKFGQQEGRVSSIARTALSSTELASLNLPQQDQNEPLYRIVVEPRRQAIEVYGHQTPLQAGMSVDAYVLQETRAIYEWMIEPLLSVNSMSHGASHAP
jgi:membrane fusion protein